MLLLGRELGRHDASRLGALGGNLSWLVLPGGREGGRDRGRERRREGREGGMKY